MIEVDTGSLVITIVAAVAALTFNLLPRRLAPPVVVIELLLGIAIGPQVLDLAESDDFTTFFANLGLGMLFFFAGYEIEFGRVRGKPLRLAGIGWLVATPREARRRPSFVTDRCVLERESYDRSLSCPD